MKTYYEVSHERLIPNYTCLAICLNLVPKVGLEPTLLSEPDFESGASTNFTTQAFLNLCAYYITAFLFCTAFFIYLFGGQGRIRTYVAVRRQIYSLLVLTTHPPVHYFLKNFRKLPNLFWCFRTESNCLSPGYKSGASPAMLQKLLFSI